jgi:hypothetical protein
VTPKLERWPPDRARAPNPCRERTSSAIRLGRTQLRDVLLQHRGSPHLDEGLQDNDERAICWRRMHVPTVRDGRSPLNTFCATDADVEGTIAAALDLQIVHEPGFRDSAVDTWNGYARLSIGDELT